MKTIDIRNGNIEEAVNDAVMVLRNGGIVLYPTDTVYGLAVDATNKEAVKRLIALKGRDAEKSISIILKDKEEISRFAKVDPVSERIIDKYMPGPITVVLPTDEKRIQHLSPDGSIGIRIPRNNFTLSLSQSFENPYTTTSANVSGEKALSRVEDIIFQFGEKSSSIDLVINDGEKMGGKPSTVVRVVSGQPQVLREGAIDAKEIEGVLLG